MANLGDGRAGNGQNNRDKTHCPKGHLLDGDNLLTADLLRGKRGCRTCHNAQNSVYQKRRRDADRACRNEQS